MPDKAVNPHEAARPERSGAKAGTNGRPSRSIKELAERLQDPSRSFTDKGHDMAELNRQLDANRREKQEQRQEQPQPSGDSSPQPSAPEPAAPADNDRDRDDDRPSQAGQPLPTPQHHARPDGKGMDAGTENFLQMMENRDNPLENPTNQSMTQLLGDLHSAEQLARDAERRGNHDQARRLRDWIGETDRWIQDNSDAYEALWRDGNRLPKRTTSTLNRHRQGFPDREQARQQQAAALSLTDWLDEFQPRADRALADGYSPADKGSLAGEIDHWAERARAAGLDAAADGLSAWAQQFRDAPVDRPPDWWRERQETPDLYDADPDDHPQHTPRPDGAAAPYVLPSPQALVAMFGSDAIRELNDPAAVSSRLRLKAKTRGLYDNAQELARNAQELWVSLGMDKILSDIDAAYARGDIAAGNALAQTYNQRLERYLPAQEMAQTAIAEYNNTAALSAQVGRALRPAPSLDFGEAPGQIRAKFGQTVLDEQGRPVSAMNYAGLTPIPDLFPDLAGDNGLVSGRALQGRLLADAYRESPYGSAEVEGLPFQYQGMTPEQLAAAVGQPDADRLAQRTRAIYTEVENLNRAAETADEELARELDAQARRLLADNEQLLIAGMQASRLRYSDSLKAQLAWQQEQRRQDLERGYLRGLGIDMLSPIPYEGSRPGRETLSTLRGAGIEYAFQQAGVNPTGNLEKYIKGDAGRELLLKDLRELNNQINRADSPVERRRLQETRDFIIDSYNIAVRVHNAQVKLNAQNPTLEEMLTMPVHPALYDPVYGRLSIGGWGEPPDPRLAVPQFWDSALSGEGAKYLERLWEGTPAYVADKRIDAFLEDNPALSARAEELAPLIEALAADLRNPYREDYYHQLAGSDISHLRNAVVNGGTYEPPAPAEPYWRLRQYLEDNPSTTADEVAFAAAMARQPYFTSDHQAKEQVEQNFLRLLRGLRGNWQWNDDGADYVHKFDDATELGKELRGLLAPGGVSPQTSELVNLVTAWYLNSRAHTQNKVDEALLTAASIPVGAGVGSVVLRGGAAAATRLTPLLLQPALRSSLVKGAGRFSGRVASDYAVNMGLEAMPSKSANRRAFDWTLDDARRNLGLALTFNLAGPLAKGTINTTPQALGLWLSPSAAKGQMGLKHTDWQPIGEIADALRAGNLLDAADIPRALQELDRMTVRSTGGTPVTNPNLRKLVEEGLDVPGFYLDKSAAMRHALQTGRPAIYIDGRSGAAIEVVPPPLNMYLPGSILHAGPEVGQWVQPGAQFADDVYANVGAADRFLMRNSHNIPGLNPGIHAGDSATIQQTMKTFHPGAARTTGFEVSEGRWPAGGQFNPAAQRIPVELTTVPLFGSNPGWWNLRLRPRMIRLSYESSLLSPGQELTRQQIQRMNIEGWRRNLTFHKPASVRIMLSDEARRRANNNVVQLGAPEGDVPPAVLLDDIAGPGLPGSAGSPKPKGWYAYGGVPFPRPLARLGAGRSLPAELRQSLADLSRRPGAGARREQSVPAGERLTGRLDDAGRAGRSTPDERRAPARDEGRAPPPAEGRVTPQEEPRIPPREEPRVPPPAERRAPPSAEGRAPPPTQRAAAPPPRIPPRDEPPPPRPMPPVRPEVLARLQGRETPPARPPMPPPRVPPREEPRIPRPMPPLRVPPRAEPRTPPPPPPPRPPKPSVDSSGGDSDKVIQPGAYPAEVQWTGVSKHTLDLNTGEHISEPLTADNVASARVTRHQPKPTPEAEHRVANLLLQARGGSVGLRPVTRKGNSRRGRRRRKPDADELTTKTETPKIIYVPVE